MFEDMNLIVDESIKVKNNELKAFEDWWKRLLPIDEKWKIER